VKTGIAGLLFIPTLRQIIRYMSNFVMRVKRGELSPLFYREINLLLQIRRKVVTLSYFNFHFISKPDRMVRRNILEIW